MHTARRMRGLTAALAVFVAAWSPAAAQADIGPQQVQALDRQGATEIIVRREPGLSAAERADVRADADVTLTRRSTLTDTEVVRADAGDLAEAVAALNDDPDVVYAEPVVAMSAQSADSYYGSQWGLENVGQAMSLLGGGGYYTGGIADADMDVPEAWTKATGAGVTVGIVDTGMLTTHPDLAAQVASNAGEIGTDGLGRDKRSNGVDDDANGYVDDWHGWDFVTAYPSISVYEGDNTAGPDNDPQDNHGHGTHVAGIVAAQRDNNEGVAGVAPGAKVMPLRALGSNGYGTNIAIAEAFDYAGKMGLRVVNASLGGPGLDQTQLTAIQAHPNTLYVLAAANDNVNNDVTPYGPCALPAANIMCVGASDQNDRRASFSNYGATSVDVFAPGTAILSTYTSPAYEYLSGTSMASPNAAGVAALALSIRPGASALDVKSAIMASSEAKPDLAGKSVTGGRVNADRAVSGVLAGAPVNVTAPAITGTPRQGVALAATKGSWDPPGTSYGYVWERSTDGGSTWTAIVGATGSTYTAGVSDIGATLRVTVTATNPYGVTSATSPAVGAVTSGAPVNTSRPVVNGTPRRGQLLTVSSAWDAPGASYTYEWQRSTDGVTWTTIGTTATYTLTTAERDAPVRVTIAATNPYGQVSVTSDPIGPVVWIPPISTSAPTISGTTQRTFTLTATTGSWDGAGNTYKYQWQRDDGGGWAPLGGATGVTYKLVKDDEGARVRVLVTATNPDGTVDRASDATAAPVSPFPPANIDAPVITGTPQRSKTLSATSGTWTGPDNTYAYQWQRDFGEGFVDIAGAKASAYTLTLADVNATVRVLVTASNPDATIVEASDPTTPVLTFGPVNQMPPSVTGTAQRGKTLTGALGSWIGAGNTYALQWQSSTDGSTWKQVDGATSATYALGVGDVGSYLRLLVTVSNPDGTASAASAATAKILGAPPVNTVKPAANGTAQRASTLTATPGTWTGNGNTYTYQWQRDSFDIPHATDPTYTLTSDDVNHTVRVLVIATNPDGAEVAASTPTATIPSAPPVNTAPPSISGATQRGKMLIGSPGTWSGIGNSMSFQWQSSTDGSTWKQVDGATSATYPLGVGDVGSYLRLLISVTNPDGAAWATSPATAKILGAPPVNTATPAVTGSAQRASTLTATPGTWTGNDNTYTYQWRRDAVDIPHATSTTYTLTADDIDHTVRVLVTATNPDGIAVAASTPTATIHSAPPVNTANPALTGTARRGSTLSGTLGSWTGAGNTYSLQWQRSRDQGASWQAIAGATTATYALAVADVGATVRLVVTATNPDGTASQASDATATVAGDGPVNTIAPSISGTAQRAATLTATPGTWSGSGNTIGYQWQRGSVDIAGATSQNYELTGADVGATVRVVVTATNPDGASSQASAPTATVKAAPPVNTSLPIVTGATVRGTTLTTSQGTWTGPAIAYRYQWQHDSGFGFTDIAGATGTTYLLGVADVGTSLRVRVTATNADGSVTVTSIASSVVRDGPPVSTAVPTISGTARRTSTLTSTRGGWNGIENQYAYQWQRRTPGGQFANIAGATNTTYTLASADVGAEIRLGVTASNLDGTLTAYSGATPAVAAAPPLNVGLPSVSGEAKLGATLTATPGDWTPAGAGYTYAWQRDGASIAGATSSTYSLQAADVGRAVRVKVTATNVDGSASATSIATARVAAPPVNTMAPAAPSGLAMETSTLTAVPGTWDTPGASFSYTWMRCPADASGITASCDEAGTGSTYTLAALDIGLRLGVRVTASSSGGTTTATGALTATVAELTLVNSTPPSIAGNAYVGETLTGDAGRWTFPSAELEYRWRRCDADGTSNCASVGDGGSRYRLDTQDESRTIVLIVVATAPGQSATAQSTPLAIRARPVPRSLSAPARDRHRGARPHAQGRHRHVEQHSRPLRVPVAALRRRRLPRDRRRHPGQLPAHQGRRGLRHHRRRHRLERGRLRRRDRGSDRPCRRRATGQRGRARHHGDHPAGRDADRRRLRLGRHGPTRCTASPGCAATRATARRSPARRARSTRSSPRTSAIRSSPGARLRTSMARSRPAPPRRRW